MRTIRLFKVWFVIGLIGLGEGSFAFAQTTNTFPDNGNAGIGVANPSYPLHISDGAVISLGTDPGDFLIRRNPPNAEIAFGADINNFRIMESGGSQNTFFVVNAAGRVGIGTQSPSNELHIHGINGAIRVQATDGGQARLVYSNEADVVRWSVGYQDGSGNFKIAESGFLDVNDRLTIQPGGNVGIGAASPTAKLHVAGDAKITGNLTTDGNIAAKYQDVAEWVRSPAALAAGTVVVIDPLENNRVLPASLPYDTRIAGVVSSQPGIVLGEAGEDKAKVAHSGRVKAKVDAQYGSVAAGDLLTSSPTPGYAMVSKPIDFNGVSLHRPGTIVGKALERLNEGQGEILVLLTLQ